MLLLGRKITVPLLVRGDGFFGIEHRFSFFRIETWFAIVAGCLKKENVISLS